MDRPIIYTQEQIRGFDIAKGWQDALKGAGRQVEDVLGGTTTVAAGLAATPTSPATLTVNLGIGAIYQYAALDPTAAGDLPLDGGSYFLQGISWAQQSVTLSTSALTSGQKQWALIQATFSFIDVIRTGDPSGGVLPFYNAANPSVPLQGQGGSGATLNTERTAAVAFSVVYGTPATAGSEVPPSAASGNVGLYLIDLAFGQTQITAGNILVAGPSVGTGVPSNYPYAPFLAGLLNQHHKGIAGQAPQIDLTSEVKNLLPAANFSTTGSFTGTFTGFTTTVTGTVNYVLVAGIAVLTLPIISGTSNATTFTMTGLPTAVNPAGTKAVALGIYAGEDNSAPVDISAAIGSNQITFVKSAGGTFTASGTKGLLNQVMVVYSVP